MLGRPLSSGGYRIGSPQRDSDSEVADAPDIMGISKPVDLEFPRDEQNASFAKSWHNISSQNCCSAYTSICKEFLIINYTAIRQKLQY